MTPDELAAIRARDADYPDDLEPADFDGSSVVLDRRALLAELDRMAAAINRVRAQHRKSEGVRAAPYWTGPDVNWCEDCDADWPCPTIAALDGVGQPEPRCEHTEHAVGVGGRRGRWFAEDNYPNGHWELCSLTNGAGQ